MLCLDANAFIQAHQKWYPFGTVPGYWNLILRHAEAGGLCSIEPVYDEILKGKDELADWVKTNKDIFHSCEPDAVQKAMNEVSDTVMSLSIPLEKREEFLYKADAWLIAFSIASGGQIVTLENARKKKGRIKIPDIADEFGVPCLTISEMMEMLGWRLVEE